MTKEDKELLLKDLCARLPYGVKVQVAGYKITELLKIDIKNGGGERPYCFNPFAFSAEQVKPYLRSMDDMTEDEIEELKSLCSIYIPTDSPNIGFEDYGIIVFTHHLTNNTYSFKLNLSVIDWLNKKMFDYRGLIEKSLAIEVTEENNPYEEFNS